MTDLLLSPHNDDETLFCSWTILRYRPHVIVCLTSHLQEQRGTGITAVQRASETARALWWLGDPTWEQWQFSDADPDWGEIERWMGRISENGYDRVFVPAFEDGGHEQHNRIAELAAHVWSGRYDTYLTYRRGEGRSVGTEVEFEPAWPARKLRALACYESQIAEPSTAYWFIDSGLREYRP